MNFHTVDAGAAAIIVAIVNEFQPFSGTSIVVDIGARSNAVPLAARRICPSVTFTVQGYPRLSVEGWLADQEQQHNIGMHNFGFGPELDRSGSLSHAICNFAIQFAPRGSLELLNNVYLKLKDEGVVGVGFWGMRIDPYIIFNKACKILEPAWDLPYFPGRGCWQTEDEVRSGLQHAGFIDVKVSTHLIPIVWDSGKQFADACFNGQMGDTTRLMASWPGDRDALYREIRRLVDDEYKGGDALRLAVIFAVGRKREQSSAEVMYKQHPSSSSMSMW